MPDEQPKIGPFSLQVPPPSPNGHGVRRESFFEPVRRAAPGLVVALVLSVSTVPRAALLGTAELAYWWRILIAAGLGGLTAGLVQHGSRRAAGLTGAIVATTGLFPAYAVVRGQAAGIAGAGTVFADLGRLAAWGAIAGGVLALAGREVRVLVASRVRASR